MKRPKAGLNYWSVSCLFFGGLSLASIMDENGSVFLTSGLLLLFVTTLWRGRPVLLGQWERNSGSSVSVPSQPGILAEKAVYRFRADNIPVAVAIVVAMLVVAGVALTMSRVWVYLSIPLVCIVVFLALLRFQEGELRLVFDSDSVIVTRSGKELDRISYGDIQAIRLYRDDWGSGISSGWPLSNYVALDLTPKRSRSGRLALYRFVSSIPDMDYLLVSGTSLSFLQEGVDFPAVFNALKRRCE